MTSTYVQLPLSTSGAKMQTKEIVDGADTVCRQVVSIGDPTTIGNVAAVGASGDVKVSPLTPTTLFANSAASNNATSVKASAGTIWSIVASNANASARYLKLYNKASSPTVGTDVPVMVIALPATSTVNINPGLLGVRFGTGIAFGIVTGAADSDNTSVAANDIKVAISYI